MLFKPLCFLLLTLLVVQTDPIYSQSINFSPSNILFSQPTYTTASDSTTFTINNSGCGYIKVNYIYCPTPEFKLNDTTAFIIPPSGSKIIQLKFSPHQNIEYNSAIIFHTSGGDFSLPVKAFGRFIEPYYDSTYNKFDEKLKSSLNTILATNYQSFSYAAARDKMFMEFDNKKINGQGATQNTLECIYTGRLAIGYIDRADCQTNYNFNTEHTWPQSLFSSNLPMVSDLNHLFPTDDVVNNYRANNPFVMVPVPVKTFGGSKGTATLFEPRDEQKGRTARAMLYFAIRYNNPAYGLVSFFGPQESILRTWCMQFLPDSIDRKRNNAIFGYQKNRNPFIDHPEFLERITSIANTSVAPAKMFVWCETQGISKNYFVYDSVDYKVVIYNNGNTVINCSKIQSSQGAVAISYSTSSILQQTALEISLKTFIQNTNTIIDTLLIENNSLNFPIIRIPVQIILSVYKVNASKNHILFANDSAILTLASSGSVNWNTGSTGNSLIVKDAGKYYATVTDSLGCHHTDTISITKSGAGINMTMAPSFSVYPNPSRNFIYIQNELNSTTHFSLVNSLGETVSKIEVEPSEQARINIAGFMNGIYFLVNETGEGSKIIIQR